MLHTDEIKRECFWYSWGGSIAKGFTSYPREFGSRCEHLDNQKFFEVHDEEIEPDCQKCKKFEKHYASTVDSVTQYVKISLPDKIVKQVEFDSYINCVISSLRYGPLLNVLQKEFKERQK